MMSNKHSGFVPDWHVQAPPEKSYRSILKWGDPQEFKHPNPRLYELMKSTFQMNDGDFQQKQKMGLEEVSFDLPTSLTSEQIDHFKKIVGPENTREDEYSRLQVAYGKTMIDLMRLREGIAENVPDLVIHPRDKEDIKKNLTLSLSVNSKTKISSFRFVFPSISNTSSRVTLPYIL